MIENIAKIFLYFPTTVLLVDDDKGFLTSVSLKLTRSIPAKLCDDPESALCLLKENIYADNLENNLKKFILESKNQCENECGKLYTRLPLYQEVYNSERFRHISTAIVDYSMPNINGRQFFEKLRESPIRKIMLTGEADYKMAVEMFNEGLIEKFVVKNSPDMMLKINESIEQATFDYFAALSAKIDRLFSHHTPIETTNQIVEKFLLNHFISQRFSERYTLDGMGSTLFVDREGNVQWVIVKSSEEIDAYLDIAQDHEAPSEIINSLSSREKIPFFWTESDDKVPVYEWGRFLHSATYLDKGYYFAYLSNPSSYPLDADMILSHQKYLEQL